MFVFLVGYQEGFGILLGSFFGSKCHAIYNILATQGALGEISLPCSENVVRALLKFCYGLPYDANLGLEDELVSWIRKGKNHGTLFDSGLMME